MVTGVYARGLLAMAADSCKRSILPQRSNAVILRMIEIIAGNPAFFTLIANF
jgi:hypothetical protein